MKPKGFAAPGCIGETSATACGLLGGKRTEEIGGEEDVRFGWLWGMGRGEVPEDYLEGFIGHRGIMKEELSELNYDVMVR